MLLLPRRGVVHNQQLLLQSWQPGADVPMQRRACRAAATAAIATAAATHARRRALQATTGPSNSQDTQDNIVPELQWEDSSSRSSSSVEYCPAEAEISTACLDELCGTMVGTTPSVQKEAHWRQAE